MNLDDLLKQGLIKHFKSSSAQVRDRLNLAKRDIVTARKLLGSDSDWAFSIAYNALLQAARAFMFAKVIGRQPGKINTWQQSVLPR